MTSEPFTATRTVELIGGPFDGQKRSIPAHCFEFYADPGPNGIPRRLHYRFCIHATSRLGKDGHERFIHADLQHDLYAR